MGWAWRGQGFLNDHRKYRRGYPGCGQVDSPFGCTTDNLYGDGDLNTGEFNTLDSDRYSQLMQISSDASPGDSGSGTYYYRDNRRFVFGVTIASALCRNECSATHWRPTTVRRITPEFFDVINTVVSE